MNHVVIYNLLEEDMTDERVEKIEKVITDVVAQSEEIRPSPELSFTFLHDPTVKSDDIPVVIIVELICDDSFESANWLKNRIAMHIGQDFRKAVRAWREVGKVKVGVNFRHHNNGYYAS